MRSPALPRWMVTVNRGLSSERTIVVMANNFTAAANCAAISFNEKYPERVHSVDYAGIMA